MSQADNLLDLFHQNQNKLTLGQILEAWRLVGSKYTNRISEIRDMGYDVECIQNFENPTENVYLLRPRINISFDQQGQGVFL